LSRVRRASSKARDKLFLFGKHLLLASGLCEQLLFADVSLFFVKIIVAGVGGDFLIGYFDDFSHQSIHKVAVVTGHYECTGKISEPLLQPND
jgi:hypothetical protein